VIPASSVWVTHSLVFQPAGPAERESTHAVAWEWKRVGGRRCSVHRDPIDAGVCVPTHWQVLSVGANDCGGCRCPLWAVAWRFCAVQTGGERVRSVVHLCSFSHLCSRFELCSCGFL